MADKLYKKAAREKNLLLSWKRLHTAQNIQYKNEYRKIFLAYEIAHQKNIKDLSERLSGQSYKPSTVLKFYLPKPSGLQRPITFLHLEDLIVYQGFVNIAADKLSDRRNNLEYKFVFSNILNRDKRKGIFFLKKWQEGYRRFRRKIKSYYESKYLWVAHFDLAAYYDTIDHNVLVKQISPLNAYPEFTGKIREILGHWSTHLVNHKLSHGIPQGPTASNYLAELYFLPIDLKLVKKGVRYVRYVDDIKVFGKNEREVQLGIILLEELCKERGLIPQSKKYAITKAKTLEDAIGKMPSLTSEEKVYIFSSEDEAYQLFESALSEESEGKIDYTKLKFILKVSGPNKKILEEVKKLIGKFPNLIDVFCSFLSQYHLDESIGEFLFKAYLEKEPSPYAYVEGQLWELLARYQYLDNRTEKISKACERIKDSYDRYALKKGLYRFLCSSPKPTILKWLNTEGSTLIQAMTIPYLPMACYQNSAEMQGLIKTCFGRSDFESALVLIKDLIAYEHQGLLDYKIANLAKSSVIQNTLTELDLIQQGSNLDPIGEILHRRFGIKHSDVWKKILGSEYAHANQVLYFAETSFHIDKNSWAGWQDSFNDILVRCFIEAYAIKYPKAEFPELVEKGKLIDYGRLLDPKNKFSQTFQNIQKGFYDFHGNLRKNPVTHPYDKKTQKRTNFIDSQKQTESIDWLKSSYSEYVKCAIDL